MNVKFGCEKIRLTKMVDAGSQNDTHIWLRISFKYCTGQKPCYFPLIYVGGKTWTQQNQAQQDLNIV